MCGIFGAVGGCEWLGSDGGAAARRMREAVAHRGPDDWGVVTIAGETVTIESAVAPPTRRPRLAPASPPAMLGHHRLAIIDLTPGGHQPRSTPDGRFWITYNGEIYNYRELRGELEQAGVRFDSESDTEVLLALYARDGPAALDRLRGMFAFAVWDDREGTLFLARDRFGMKPLVWAEPRAGCLLFASEAKACLASGLVGRELDPAALVRFLRFGYLPAAASAHLALRPLAPGHWLRWSRAGVVTHRYWSLGAALADGPARVARVEEAARVLETALVDSVRAHLVSDVPVGIFLSGGLDSTAVLAAARRVASGRLKTFTVTCPDARDDEGETARATAARFATEHVEVVVTAQTVFADLDRFFDAMDEPTADGLNTFVVAKAAREAGLKTALSGLGGDELLGGYASFVAVPRLLQWVRAADRLAWARRTTAALAERLGGRHGAKLAEILGDGPAEIEDLWPLYRARFTRAQIAGLVGDGLAETSLAGSAGPSRVAASAHARPDRTFWRLVGLEIEEFMTPQLVRDADQFTMTWGLELRTPFVDHVLLAAMRAVGEWRRRRGRSHKATLFEALPHFVPPRLARRPKRGFFLPIDRWLREALASDWPRDEGFAALATDARYRPVVEAFLRGRLHWSRPWALYVLERFRRRAMLA